MAEATDARPTEVAILAGGCFWGMEEILRHIPGVLETEVGYTGGWLENPTYHDTHDSKSGHAESVRIVFDPTVLSYETLLEDWFFRMHDPTTLNRQGNDIGTQYRSAIFFTSEQQRETAYRFARSEVQMAEIIRVLNEHNRILTEHGRMIERLTDAVREKIGFKGQP